MEGKALNPTTLLTYEKKTIVLTSISRAKWSSLRKKEGGKIEKLECPLVYVKDVPKLIADIGKERKNSSRKLW